MSGNNNIVLSVRNLTKTYRTAGEQVNVLRGVNLDVAAGERVALSGESGSGKSTLLHLIAAASDAACDVADWAGLGDRAVERRAGVEPAGPHFLRSRGGDVRRHANRHAGRAQRRDASTTALCRFAPGRLAGLARAGGARPDRGTLVPPARDRAGDATRRGRQRT